MFKFSAVSQIWKKYIQKLNDWDLPVSKKQKYRGMFETQKSGKQDKFRRDWSQH